MNNLVIVGKLKEEPMIKETNNGLQFAQMILEVERNYANAKGTKDSDLYQINLWKGLVDEAKHLPIGSYIVVKGRLQANNYQRDDGLAVYRNEIVAEKVSCLS